MSPEYSSGAFSFFSFQIFLRISPAIQVCLEHFYFPLCASKPGCELSKVARKDIVKTQRGEYQHLQA